MDYGLELIFCSISTPIKKQCLVDIEGADGHLDLLEGMGPARYEMRTVSSEFRFVSNPKDSISRLMKDLEGKTVPIILPDDPGSYVTGTVHIQAAGRSIGSGVVITATCMPWRYSRNTVRRNIPAADSKEISLRNAGSRQIVPTVEVTGTEAMLTCGEVSISLVTGTHLVPDLAIPGGAVRNVTVSGGPISISYQEANL